MMSVPVPVASVPVASHVDTEDKTTTLIQGTGSNYKSKMVIINESGLYSLILSSKLPQAKEFKRWGNIRGAAADSQDGWLYPHSRC